MRLNIISASELLAQGSTFGQVCGMIKFHRERLSYFQETDNVTGYKVAQSHINALTKLRKEAFGK